MKADVTQIPDKTSQGAEWLTWYIACKAQWGKAVANQVFLKAWKTRGSSSASTHELREYLSKNGVDLDKGILSSLYDSGAGFIEGIGSFLNVGKYITIGVLGIGAVTFLFVVYNVVKNPNKYAAAAGTASKAAI